MIDKLNITEEIDWTTVGIYLMLVIFGWMNIFASSYNEQFTSIFNIRQNYGDQLLWILVSLIMIILLFAIDYRFFHYFAYVIYGFSIFFYLRCWFLGLRSIIRSHGYGSWISIFSLLNL